MVLILAMRGRPNLIGVARVHVEDSSHSASTQGHLSAAVQNDLGASVVEHLCGLREHDFDRVGAAVEGDHAALCDRRHHRRAGAALRSTASDHLIRVGDVLFSPFCRDRA